MRSVYAHYGFFKTVFIDGASLQTVAVGIYGVQRIIQYACYAGAILYAEPHKGKNAQIGVQQFSLLQLYAAVGAQQGVDTGNETRIDVQESVVEDIVELTALLFDELARFAQPKEFVGLPGRKFALDDFAQLVEFIHINGT